MNVTITQTAASLAIRPLAVQVVRQFAPGRGGLEDVVANLSRFLLKRGYRVRVVTCNSLFSDPDCALADFEMIDGVEVVRVPWRGSPRYPVAPDVFRHLVDADIIHVHAIDFFFDALALGSFLHRKPMVVTTHGGFFHTRKYAAIKKIWFQTLTRLSALAYRQVLCCSQSDLALFRKIAGKRAVLVENGVDTGKFADRASRVAQRRLVTIGRFSVNKRLDRLLDAMAVLARRDPRWHLDIVGAPGDFSAQDIKREIAHRRLGGHVSMHVSVDNSAICDVLNHASLFVAASVYEGFGLAAVEAMSAGLVPILQPNDAYQALSKRHGGVLLADFSYPEESARTIEAAYSLVESDVAGRRNAMIAAADEHSWARMAVHYGEIYQSVLGAAAPATSGEAS